MKIATIILNYNSSADCKKCIAHLMRQTGIEQEIIVVDNCSRDEERAAAEAVCKATGCTFIANDTNRGYNAGNNTGLRYAAGKGYEFAMIANPDMEFPQSDYIEKLLAPMLDNEDIAVCGSDIVTPEGIHQNPAFRDGDWKESFGPIKGLFHKKPVEKYGFIDDFSTSHYCSKVSGCCLMVRMSFIESIGFFDEYPKLYCEEAILSRQVEGAGKKMFYTADTQATHAHIKSQKGNAVERFKQWRRSRLYFIKKYSGDHAFGRFVAGLSMRIYIGIMILIKKIKK